MIRIIFKRNFPVIFFILNFVIGESKDCLIPFKLYLTKSLLAFLPIYFIDKGFFSNVKSK